MALAQTAELAVLLKLNDQMSGGLSQASSSLSRFGSHVTGTGGAMSKFSGAMGHAKNQIASLVTSPLGLIGMAGGMYGVASAIKSTVDSATTFQASMELIATQAGGTQAEVDSMTKAILAMAGSVGTAPDALAAGLYHIESAGIRGAKALDVLKIAAEGAKVGNADLESVTNALVAAVNSGIKGANDMGGAMGTLNAIVGAGNMRMQDLTDSFSTGLLSSAKTFGVSLQSVGAAIADMTNQGVPAIDAATRLRMTLSLLAAPTSKAAKSFEAIGLGQLTLAQDMRGPQGILGAVSDLAAHMRKAGMIDANGNPNSKGAAFLSGAFGGGRSSSAIMTLIGSLGKLNDIQNQINKGAGTFDAAWQKTQQDAQFQMDKFQAVLGAVAVKIGDVLLPLVNEGFSTLSSWLDTHQQQVVDFFQAAANGVKNAAGFISGTIMPVVKGIWDAWNGLPPELRDLIVKGVVADRATKFLFGFSPIGSIVSGITGALGKSMASSLVSAGIGKAFVQPVFVTNPGFGGGGGGLPGGLAGAGEAAGGGLAALATSVLPLAIGIAAPIALSLWLQANAKNNNPVEPISVNAGTKGGYTIPGTGVGGVDYFTGLIPSFVKNSIAVGNNTISLQQLGKSIDDMIHGTGTEAHAGKLADDQIPKTRAQLAAIKARVAAAGAASKVGQAINNSLTSQSLQTFRAGERASERVAANTSGASRNLDRIAAKRTSFTANTTVNITTTVSVRDINTASQQRARYTGRSGFQAI